MTTKMRLLANACLAFWLMLAAAGRAAEPLLLLSPSEAQAIKQAVQRNDPQLAPVAERLRRDAEARMKMGPWSVTFHRPKGTTAGPHDYFSEGPYWWPDPANPGGPYIRRDGERNPDRFTANHDDLSEMSDSVLSLGMAAWLFDDPRYAERAAKAVSAWFIDEATRMNPHLEYGQAIKNVSSGRGAGIIDSVPLIWAVQGMTFLERTGRWKSDDQKAVRKWFAGYLEWLTHSKKGLDEKKSGNNHSTWWTAQVAGYAAFAGDRALRQMVWDHYRDYLIPQQMLPDGSCPREEARTKSLGYSAMNLAGFSVICRLADTQGVDLWRFRAPNGAGLEKAVAYLAPYVVQPEKWTKKQIVPFENERCYFLALAGMALKSPEYVGMWRRLDRPSDPRLLLVDLLVAIWK